MKNVLARFGWLVVPATLPACGGTLTVRAAAPPPPVVTVGVGVSAQAPPPPPAPPGPPAPPPPATADATVEVEPISQGDPEEVTATTEPPDPVYEEPTPSPNPGWVWVGGYWGWNGTDWGWNWGRWAEPPAGRVYIQPYYERVGSRVVYVRGYWGPHDAPRRSYGGERIRFTPAVRPANYHPGEHIVVEHRAGPMPGKRPGGAYERATGAVRPLPKATAPAHRMADARETATVHGREGEGPAGHEHESVRDSAHESGRGEAGHDTARETGRGEAGHDTARETGRGETGRDTARETGRGDATRETAHGNSDSRAPQRTEPGDRRAAPARGAPPKKEPEHEKR